MNRHRKYFCFACAFLALSACGPIVKEVDYAPTLTVPKDAHPAPIRFSGFEMLLPPGGLIGRERASYGTCGLSRYPVGREIFHDEIDREFVKQEFHDVLEASGYDVVDSLEIAFDHEDELQRAEYAIKAKIRDAQLDMCSVEPSLISDLISWPFSTESQLYLAIDWTVYDQLRRTTIFKTRTEGYSERRMPIKEGINVLFNDAFVMATHNLAADHDFYALLVEGKKPPREKTIFADRDEDKWNDRPRLFNPQEQVVLPDTPLSRQPFAKNANQKGEIGVMLQTTGHGSGFFITKQGHILTNAHVTGKARRMRVVSAQKKIAMVAEVLRIDRPRDVALLKLEEIPPELNIEPLPIRTDWPIVGEDVFAIGAPLDYRQLRDTLTKGIVSAHRPAMKFLGTRQNFIQADVEIHGGSSGGPLIDEHGNIVGLTVGSVGIEDIGIGLNYFIPIGEALEKLNIVPPRNN